MFDHHIDVKKSVLYNLFRMGVAVSSDSDHRRSYQLSKRIDQELQLEKRNNMAVLKLLLLGKKCYKFL